MSRKGEMAGGNEAVPGFKSEGNKGVAGQIK